ncbi:MAG: helix-turn-helix transcriptional regulator [Clostridia bacterium]|nr:helix-turn-helix transcriptional regulator [Clostridia bacterium]
MDIRDIKTEDYLKTENLIQDQIDDIILALLKERKRKKITQTELSALTDIPQTTISRIESFASIPTLQILLKIANALGLNLVVLRKKGENEFYSE